MANDHALKLGKLLGNFQSLEAVLRVYLLKIAQKQRAGGPLERSYWTLQVGDTVDADEFSNYDSLGALIKEFNDDVLARDASLVIDTTVVEVRDLLAHGRVAGDKEDTATLRLVKCSRPAAGKVTVVASTLMDDDWFAKYIPLAREQIMKVGSALEQYAT